MKQYKPYIPKHEVIESKAGQIKKGRGFDIANVGVGAGAKSGAASMEMSNIDQVQTRRPRGRAARIMDVDENTSITMSVRQSENG